MSDDGFFWKTAASPEKLAYLDRWTVPGRVLDLGCGAGHYTRYLAGKGHAVVPVDAEPQLPDGQALGFVQARAEQLPFPDKSFDVTLAFDILEHVAADRQALAEIRRVTKRRVILSVPAKGDERLYPYGLCLLHHVDKTHVREYSAEDLRRDLGAAGFTVQDLQPSVATQMPLVVREFFAAGPLGKILGSLTVFWIRALKKLGIVRAPCAGDLLCVADLP